jgi:1-acyl-sn-glycerol-3-phosphate acyltransferase
LLGWFFPLTVAGSERIPDGPVVFAANHFSHLDPVAVSIAVKRPVRYLAVDELYGNSFVFDTLTLWLGAIPMSRSRVPLGALRTALAELDAGGSVGVYPEGVRVWTWGEVDPPKRGAAWLARRAGVPLVPVAVAGSDQALGRGTRRAARRPIHVEVCHPIRPDDFEDVRDPLGAMMAAWWDRIDAALASAYGP